jgi:proline iminopeptidase
MTYSKLRPRIVRVSAKGSILGLAALLVGGAAVAQAPRAPDAAAAGALAAGAHEVVIDGVRFWYRVAGTGARGAPPVVFLHGGPGYNSHSFATLAGARLEPSLRMVYYDQRGSGRSERPWSGEYSIARLVEDVEGLRRTLGVPRIALIGHSFGGTLALEYAARYPERVSRMVLVGPAADIPAACAARREWLARHHAAALARAIADTAGRGGPRSDCDLAFQTLQGAEHQAANNAVMFPDSALRRLQDSVDAASGLRNTGEMGGALFGGGLLEYRFTGHARLTMPVLVVAGRHDSAIGLPQQRALARALPNARVVEYERGGHFPYLEEPERFAREVTAFLSPAADADEGGGR